MWRVRVIIVFSRGLLGRLSICRLLGRVWVWPRHLVRVGGVVRSRLLASAGMFPTVREVSWGLLGGVGVLLRLFKVSWVDNREY